MTASLRRTPLFDTHVRLGGRMVPFAGWEMPVQYADGIIAETKAVRTAAGVFDVSHMGRIFLDGQDAQALLNWVHTNDIGPDMAIGRSRYGLICNEQGGITDDAIIYRLTPDRFLLIANASNAAEVYAWLQRWQHLRFPRVILDDVSDRIAMIALQGPRAMDIVSRISAVNRAFLKPFWITKAAVLGRSALMARTGYTGEDGVEIMPPADKAEAVWDLLMREGAKPAGLGARDVLRLEAGLPLHGNDISLKTTPVEAGLERFIAKNKTDFCGSETVLAQLKFGATRRLAGFRTIEKGPIPRSHLPLIVDGQNVGEVSSGGYSPTLDRNIGLGYVPVQFAQPGTRLHVDIRGRLVEAEIVPLPFYRRT